MDEGFRRHDIVYHLAKSRPPMLAADEALSRWLGDLDENTLSPKALTFRRRALNFFGSPVSKVLGKPVSTLVVKDEVPSCPFRTEEQVWRFFSKDHSGFPEVGGSFR
jgi:hypothetical protein